MTAKNLLRVTAIAEGGMALAFLLVPSLASQLLFGQPSQVALAEILGRLLGAAVLSLATVCWWAGGDCRSPMAYSVIKAVLVYDVVAAALLVYARMDLGLSGILLWVGILVHMGLGACCVVALKRR